MTPPPRARPPGEERDPLGGLTLVRVLAALGIWARPGPPPDAGRARATCDPRALAAARAGDPPPAQTRDARSPGCDELLDDACARAQRAGHAPATITLLRDAWEALGPDGRLRVAAPLASDAPTWRGRPAVQVDGTTCGAAVGAMLLAAGDPVVALALETGTVLGAGTVLETGAAPAGVRSPAHAPALTAAAAGFDELQRHLLRATSRRAVLGLLPWPRRFGTPPWGLAREARCADVRYRHVVVDVGDRPRTDALAAHIEASLRAGTPLPLFTGGASRTGWSTAVPRHVVLLVDVEGTSWRVYEPSRGRVLTVDARTWAVPERRDAWGRWSRPHWILLPG